MNWKAAVIAAIMAVSPTTLRSLAVPPGPEAAADADYVKVDAKGTLHVAANYKFDPKADPKTVEFFGATVAAGSWGCDLQLLVTDRKQFDLLKSNDGKKIVLSGDLETVALPYNAANPPLRVPPIRRYIRVREVRLADQK